MPRSARIDAPGALHHIIFRGIDRRRIFRDNADRENFLDRVRTILSETETPCFAWALIPNHVHLLLRTGTVPISRVMRRLLTGHAVWFNRRHRRHGHVFQSRYKSILCQEEPYLLELVRYIHLNPVRARLVRILDDLDSYPYSGHSTLVGTIERSWQDTDTVLRRFSNREESARQSYREFVREGLDMGKRDDLIGGGLRRSLGGWADPKELRKEGIRMVSDERILGDSDFVAGVLQHADEELERKTRLKKQGLDLRAAAERAATLFNVCVDDILRPGKSPLRSKARSLFCYWAVRELDHTTSSIALYLGLTQPAISKAVSRGEQIAREFGLQLEERKL